MRRKTRKIVEGRWNCPYCGTIGIKGHEKNCPNCGGGKPPGTKHYLLPEDREHPLTGEELEKFDWNPNWICPYCGFMNPNADKECQRCGHPRSKEDKDPFDLRLEKANIGKEREAEQKKEEENILPKEEPIYSKRKESHWGEAFKKVLVYLLDLFKRIILSLWDGLKSFVSLFTAERIIKGLKVLGILAVISFFIYLVAPKWVTLKIEGFKWNREVTIEKLQTVEESGYYLPENARLISTTEEPDDDNNNHSSWNSNHNSYDDDDNWWSSSDSNSSWSNSNSNNSSNNYSNDDNDSGWSYTWNSWSSSYDDDDDYSWSNSYDDDDSWWSSNDSNSSWSSYDDGDDDYSWWSSSDSSDSSWSSSYDDDDDWDWYYDYDDDYDFENGYFEIYDFIRIPFDRFKIYIRRSIFNKTKYHYEIDKWVYDRTLSVSGEDHEPYWPDTNLPEDERVSSQREWFYVSGTDSEGKEYELKLSYSDWQKISLGDEVKFEISFGGGVRIIND